MEKYFNTKPSAMFRNFCILTIGLIAGQQALVAQGFQFRDEPSQKQVDLLYNGQWLTSYCYYDSSRKPVLFPVNTLEGVTVTRGFPFAPRPGERTDHPHHSGIWLNYESVNGLDFWNNSTAIAPEKRNLYGTIVHEAIERKSAGKDSARLQVKARWIRPDGKAILEEHTTYIFRADGTHHNFFIDRITRLQARDIKVDFKDVKDGFFAIRVARELELPSKEKSQFVDDKGNVTTVPPSSAADVTGMYYSSNGLTGDSVWGTQGTWVMLTGEKDGEQITIGMFDHPDNPGYPAYWHARGYGLFAVNPLGRKIFSNGKEEMNLTLAPGQYVRFRYRIVVHSGPPLSRTDMEQFAAEFSRVK